MNSYLDNFFDESEELYHYGIKRRSGRYPWGSGKDPFQHDGNFLNTVVQMQRDGKSEREIAEHFKISTTQLRVYKNLAKKEQRTSEREKALALQAEGLNTSEIAKRLGYKNESSIRNLLDDNRAERQRISEVTADILKSRVDKEGYIDISEGAERWLGNISREKLNEAATILTDQGYEVYPRRVPQATNPGKMTTMLILCKPGTEYKDIYNIDYTQIKPVTDVISKDGGETYNPRFVYPESMDSKRLMVRYGDEGGKTKDGVIELRRGVEDLSLGESNYAQVRILVDGTHYLKGMAVYGDPKEFPDGVDVIFNTNKNSDTPTLGPKNNTILKPIKRDKDGNPMDNPFGSLIKDGIDDPENSDGFMGGQRYYIDENGNKKLSLINKRQTEGDWNDWDNKLSSQFLSKQNMKLISTQLDKSYDDRFDEYKEISELTNPTLKKYRLREFAENCEAAAEHLKAAGLPRQRYQVLLPIDDIKDDEVFAPNYEPGETVALIRYPHGGTFEIPILKVNNKNAEGLKRYNSDALDVVGVNSKVAARLSGADFDGDTVMVIPCNSPNSKVKITSTKPLKDLEGFDPKEQYGGKPEGSYKPMKDTQKQMGMVSNLINDMTLMGANENEIARAVRHSMVVIDAEKHGLDYKQSEIDNGIKELKDRYQNGGGASTLISKASAPMRVPKTQGEPRVNLPDKPWYDPHKPIGAQIYKEADDARYIDKSGKEAVRTKVSSPMRQTDDAMSLISSNVTANLVEKRYAEYANKLKTLGNTARAEAEKTKPSLIDSNAKAEYSSEVARLKAAVNVSEMNKPRERQAQLYANSKLTKVQQENPDLKEAEKKKLAQQYLTEGRSKYGAKREEIYISDNEWKAIQSGAISSTLQEKIFTYANKDRLNDLASPKTRVSLSNFKISKMKSMNENGHTNEEIARALGVSVSTIIKYLKEG